MKEKILVVFTIIAFVLINSIFTIYTEKQLSQQTKKGALEWSIMYGSNEKSGGYWSTGDGEYVLKRIESDDAAKDFLNIAKNRYRSMGYKRTIVLLKNKFSSLWATPNGIYDFLITCSVTNHGLQLIKYKIWVLNKAAFTFVMLFALFGTASSLKKGEKRTFIIEIFSIGYILANLIVCVNGRYSYPIAFLLLIIAAKTQFPYKSNKCLKFMDKL